MSTYTAREVAELFRCSVRKVTDTASAYRIGTNLRGRAGYRFTDELPPGAAPVSGKWSGDLLALWVATRPDEVVAPRRRRRTP